MKRIDVNQDYMLTGVALQILRNISAVLEKSDDGQVYEASNYIDTIIASAKMLEEIEYDI